MFKNLLAKLGTHLYLKYGKPDIVSMTRQQLQCFNEFKPVEMNDETKELLARQARDLLENKFLQSIFDEVVTKVKEKMLLNTDAQFIILDRFSINGISLIRERISNYACSTEKEEEFDPYAL